MKGIAQDITLRNNKVELTLSSKGAIVKKAVIKGYVGHDLHHQNHTDDKNYVTLFDATSQSFNYSLATKEANINTADLYFEPSSYNDSTVTFTATSKAGQTITMQYRLGRDYLLHMNFSVKGMDGNFMLIGKTGFFNKRKGFRLRIAMPHSPIMPQKEVRII